MDVCRVVRRIRAVLDEMNYASARVASLRFAEDFEPSDRAPDTYAEFLFRSSAVVLHEPPASQR